MSGTPQLTSSIICLNSLAFFGNLYKLFSKEELLPIKLFLFFLAELSFFGDFDSSFLLFYFRLFFLNHYFITFKFI